MQKSILIIINLYGFDNDNISFRLKKEEKKNCEDKKIFYHQISLFECMKKSAQF